MSFDDELTDDPEEIGPIMGLEDDEDEEEEDELEDGFNEEDEDGVKIDPLALADEDEEE